MANHIGSEGIKLTEQTIENNKQKIILSRLKLAQSILEDSDKLPGFDGYDFESEGFPFHPRHERESLVIYLLLTCFDRLGQGESYISLGGWLESSQKKYNQEKQRIIESLSPQPNFLEIARELSKGYNSIYGVRNAFYSGVLNLPEEFREKLFDSIDIRYQPNFDPNVSARSYEIEDPKLSMELKLKYLFELRNRFTHSLNQYQTLSTPSISQVGSKSNACWYATVIDNKRIKYATSGNETKLLEDGTAHMYALKAWPFVLFESIYGGIGIDFERTSINLNFEVHFWSRGETFSLGYMGPVLHKEMKDIEYLKAEFHKRAKKNN